MFYAYDITVPAGTLDASPVTQQLRLTAGIVKDVEIKFRAGCQGLVKVQILQGQSVIVPLSTDQYVTGDNETVTAHPSTLLTAGSTVLLFHGSSPSASYQHIITVRINVEPTEPLIVPVYSIEEMLYRICVALDVHDGLVPLAGWDIGEVPTIIIPPTVTPPTPEMPAEGEFDWTQIPEDVRLITDVHDFFNKSSRYYNPETSWYIVQTILAQSPDLSILLRAEYPTWNLFVKKSYDAGYLNYSEYMDMIALRKAAAERLPPV